MPSAGPASRDAHGDRPASIPGRMRHWGPGEQRRNEWQAAWAAGRSWPTVRRPRWPPPQQGQAPLRPAPKAMTSIRQLPASPADNSRKSIRAETSDIPSLAGASHLWRTIETETACGNGLGPTINRAACKVPLRPYRLFRHAGLQCFASTASVCADPAPRPGDSS